jgi:signal transduction histidine kinase
VENIKKLSRIDEEKIIKKINLNHILNEAVSYIKRRYNEKRINITIDTKENNLHGLGNNFLIDVFKNLFRNSVKYNNNPNTEIKIEFEEILEDSNHLLKIDVIDNGIGIPKAQKQAIIQEKIGEHKSLKRIGLGLALVKKILTNMGGSFYISNRIKENPSKGTKFTILVPKA